MGIQICFSPENGFSIHREWTVARRCGLARILSTSAVVTQSTLAAELVASEVWHLAQPLVKGVGTMMIFLKLHQLGAGRASHVCAHHLFGHSFIRLLSLL